MKNKLPKKDKGLGFLRHWKVMTMTLLLLTFSIGQMWGADQTFTVEGPVASKRYVQDNIMMTGEVNASKKIANASSGVPVFYLQTGNYAPTAIISKAANIKKVVIYGNRDTGSNSQAKAFSLYTSADAISYAIPTTGVTATATNNSSPTAVTSMTDINMIGNNQSYATTITVTFTSPVMALRLVASANTSIRSIEVTYDPAITPTNELCELHMTSNTEFSFSGTGSFTKTNIQTGNTLTDTEATPNTFYYTKTSGEYGYIDLGTGNTFQEGDEIWLDMMTTSRAAGNNVRLVYKLNKTNSDEGAVNVNPTCSIAANMATYVRYITQAGDPWVGEQRLYIRRSDSNNRLYQVTIHRAPVSETCPSGISITGTTSYTEGQTISLSAQLEEGNGSIIYTWYKGADLATAKAAGSIGTGASYSKASCVTDDAGKYWCVATKAECPDAESSAYNVAVSEAIKYDVAFAAGTGATGEMSTLKRIEGATITIPAPTFTAPSGKYFSNWTIEGVVGKTSGQIGETFDMPAENVTLTANWVSSLEGNVVFNVAVKNTAASQTTTIPFYISELVGETSEGAGTVSDISKTDRSGKYATNCTSGKGVKFTFDVKDGFEFAPSAIAVQLASVSTYEDFTFTATLSDENSTVLTSNEIVPTSDGTLTTITFPAYNKSFKGTTTLLLSVCKTGDAGTYRIGKPITITGTIAEVDVTAPTFVSSVPANSATGVDVSGTIVLTFSEDIASVDDSKFSLSNATIGTVAIDGTDATKVNVPYTDAVNEATVTLSVDAEAVADAAGNKSAALSDIAFTIAASGVCVKPDAPEDLGVEVKTNNYAKFIWDNGTAGANGYEISLTSEAVGAAGKFDWKDEDDAIYEATGLTPETEYTFKVKYKGTVDDCYSDEVTTTFTTYAACTELVPETSGDSPSAIGEEIRLQGGSTGGKIYVADNKAGKTLAESFTYTANGISLNTGGKDSLRVELSSLMKVGTVISAEIYNANDDKARGLLLQNMSKTTKATWTTTMVGTHYETYTVVAGDGLAGSNKFLLARSETAALKSLTVSNCGDAVYEVTFDMKDHGLQVAKQVLTAGAKVTEPTEPEAAGYIFGGWYKETTLENVWNFSTDVVPSNNITLYAKWTEDPCTDRQSLSKVVLTSATAGTVTGHNSNEYAGTAIIASLKDDSKTADIIGDANKEKGYKLNSGGNSIVMATLKKGDFQEGDKVTVGVILKNDQRTVDASMDILTLYAGSDKDHMMEVATIKNVSDPGFYTYRLTAADATAINAAGYKSIGLFRASSNGENHNIYSVEITGCRSFAVPHQVTYDMMGHGTQVDPQSVPEGDKLTKPTVVEPEGWAFVGWYKENTLENEWDFTTDVMGTTDMTLYAKWEDETTAIKLIVDDTPSGKKINDEAYYTGSPLTSVTISEVETPCVKLAGGATAATAPYSADKNDNRVIAYCAQTTQTKIRVTAYSNTNSARPYTISFVEEGQIADQADDNNVIVNLPTDGTIHTTDWYTFNNDKNRTIYITIPGNASNYHFLQVKVIESGTPIKKAGDLGYSMNFNIGRPIGVKQTLHKNFEGFDFYANNDYKVLQSTSMVISNATNDYIKFHAAAPMTLAVTTENAASFYVTKAAKGTGNETLSTAGGISYIDLDEAADWYISPKSGDVKIQKIEFIAPKCAEPTITPMSNSDLCEGDDFAALAVSASVSDGGTLHYQWYKHPATGDDEAVGTDAASYTPETDGQYYVVVTNRLADHSDNSATSNTITVTHFAAAVITTAPLNQRGEVGDVVTLTVAATGKNVAYKWYTCDEDGGNEVALDPAETGTSINVTITAGLLQWYKVKVTSDCGGAEAKAKVSEFVPTTPANVTESIVWDWESSAWPASGQVAFTAQVEDGTDLTPAYELLADADAIVPNNAAFRSDMLYGKGQWVWRSGNKFFQGTAIKFTTEVAGLVRVNYRSTGNNKEVQVTIAGTPAGKNKTSNFKWSEYVEVPAGAVEILCLATDENKSLTRVQKIEFLALENRRTAGWIKPGELGTVCLENTSIVEGATIYELQGPDQYGKLVFDEVQSGEVVAGIPYLFEATATGQISFYKKVNAAHAGEAGELNGMHGTFSGETFSPSDGNAANLYYFSGNAIWCVANRSTSANIPAHGCYLNMEEFRELPIPSPTPAPGRRRITLGVNGKNTPTGIENGELLNGENGVQKVLINGELFILRGEKMYDATGRLVK